MHPNSLANLKPSPENMVPNLGQGIRNAGDKPRRFKVSECLKRLAELPAGEEYIPETNAERVAVELNRYATAGRLDYAKEYMDRTEGPVVQKVEVQMNPETVLACSSGIAEFVPRSPEHYQELVSKYGENGLQSAAIERFLAILTSR